MFAGAVRVFCTMIVYILVPLSPVCADWINLTGAETAPNIAEIRVLEDRVNVRLEVYIGDLERFADLIPDKLMKHAEAARPSEGERLKHFADEVLRITSPDGAALPAKLKLVEPRLRVDRKSRTMRHRQRSSMPSSTMCTLHILSPRIRK